MENKKICHVVFSTNRINYLEQTLESMKKVNYEGVYVDHLIIDDYPTGRNNNQFKNLVFEYGFDEVILHEENQGITKTWQEMFDYVKARDYDYIFHNEDDVKLLHPIKMTDMIEILESDDDLFQIQMKRNNWYVHEEEEIKPQEDDVVYNNYRYEKNPNFFWMLMSLYPSWIAKEPILEDTGYHPSEYVVAKYLLNKYGRYSSALVKTKDGENIVDHIGDYSQGKRVLENEPGWDKFKYYSPDKKYCSRTGAEWNEN
jgi:hypothetical protein